MTKVGRLTRALVTGLVIVSLASCAKVYRNHGYVPSDEDLASVIVGVDTQSSVEAAIGVPTSGGVVRDTAWYYVGSRWEHYIYRKPVPIEREIVAVSFDGDGVVSNIERFGLEDGEVVTLSRRVTDSNIQGITFLRQLMGNLGRFNPGDILGGN